METATKTAAGQREAKRKYGALLTQLLWLCPLVSVALAVLLFWLSGVTPWTAAIAGLLLGCPIAVAWALFDAWREQRKSIRGETQ
jgi:hypothetical protein